MKTNNHVFIIAKDKVKKFFEENKNNKNYEKWLQRYNYHHNNQRWRTDKKIEAFNKTNISKLFQKEKK